MTIYELAADANRFENLHLPSEEAYDQLLDAFDREPMSETWIPRQVRVMDDQKHRNRPSSDFPSLDGVIPVFSARAIDALRDMLEDNGEILSLNCPDGKYYAYNVLRTIDALDEEHSKLVRFDTGDIMHIQDYAFHPEPLRNAILFKLPRLRNSRIFVSDAFVERVREAGLVGFWFKPVWSTAEESV